MLSGYLIRSVAAAALLAQVTAPLWATEPLSLREAQQLAAARSPQLVAQDALVRAAREMAISAAELPDPVLKLGIDNLPVNGSDSLSLTRDSSTARRIGIMQEFPRQEKRQLKAERFEHELQRAQAQRQMALANIQRDTALAWIERYYAQNMRALLLRQLGETRLQVEGADIAFRAGRGTQADVFAARSALINLEDRLSQIDRQTRSASLMLARWIGPDADRPLLGQPDWKNLGDRDSRRLDSIFSTEQLKQQPELAVLAAQVEAAETEARLAQANTRSDWSVEAAYSQRGPSFSNMVSLGVSIPLQWDPAHRQKREVGAKLALVEEARAVYEDRLQSREAEVRGLLNDWQSGIERVSRYTSQLLPVAGNHSEAALTAYRIGKSDLANALAARRDEIETSIQALTLELETARLWAQLNYLTPDNAQTNGATPAPIPTLPVSAKEQP